MCGAIRARPIAASSSNVQRSREQTGGGGIDVNGMRLILILLSITGSAPFVSRGMAAGMERVFSGAKELITDRRNALDMESIQANEYFRNWGATP
jgi:hypothetical protein